MHTRIWRKQPQSNNTADLNNLQMDTLVEICKLLPIESLVPFLLTNHKTYRIFKERESRPFKIMIPNLKEGEFIEANFQDKAENLIKIYFREAQLKNIGRKNSLALATSCAKEMTPPLILSFLAAVALEINRLPSLMNNYEHALPMVIFTATNFLLWLSIEIVAKHNFGDASYIRSRTHDCIDKYHNTQKKLIDIEYELEELKRITRDIPCTFFHSWPRESQGPTRTRPMFKN